MISNAELCANNFSVNDSILPKIVGFLKIFGEIQQLVQKRLQKIKFDVIYIAFHYIFNQYTYQISAPFKNDKKGSEIVGIWSK